MSNEIHVPAIGEEEMPPEAITDAKIDMVLSGLLVPSQGFSKALARQVRALRAEVERPVLAWDEECGAAYLYFQPARRGEKGCVKETVLANVDIGNDGLLYGIEILDLSQKEAEALTRKAK